MRKRCLLSALCFALVFVVWYASENAYDPSEAYRHSPFFSPAFLAEKARLQRTWDLHEDGAITSPDFHGAYFNVVDNHRAVPGQPPEAKRTLWLFGSSTLYDYEVPDDYTLAADLQRMTRLYRVVNMGLLGTDTEQAAAELLCASIRSGDIVVLYDGLNELTPVYKAKDRAQRALQVLARYRQAVIVAHDYTLSRGAQFFHFLPPTIYPQLNRYERWLVHSNKFPYPGMDAAYVVFWPMLHDTPYTIDLSHALDVERAKGTALFFDGGHLNEVGDAIVARAIYAAVFGPF